MGRGGRRRKRQDALEDGRLRGASLQDRLDGADQPPLDVRRRRPGLLRRPRSDHRPLLGRREPALAGAAAGNPRTPHEIQHPAERHVLAGLPRRRALLRPAQSGQAGRLAGGARTLARLFGRLGQAALGPGVRLVGLGASGRRVRRRRARLGPRFPDRVHPGAGPGQRRSPAKGLQLQGLRQRPPSPLLSQQGHDPIHDDQLSGSGVHRLGGCGHGSQPLGPRDVPAGRVSLQRTGLRHAAPVQLLYQLEAQRFPGPGTGGGTQFSRPRFPQAPTRPGLRSRTHPSPLIPRP